MDSQDLLHPNWKALASAHLKYKVFVRAQPDQESQQQQQQQQDEEERRLQATLDGEDAKRFYEELLEGSSQSGGSAGLEESPAVGLEKDSDESDDCYDVEELRSQRGPQRKQDCISDINKAMTLAQNNDKAGLKKLLASGFNVNTKDTFGWSLLMVAACAGAEDTVRILLRHRARTGARDSKGNTALYLATMKGHKRIVDMLIKSSKHKGDKNKSGEDTVIDSTVGKQTEEFFCESCQNTITESTPIQHQTSIVHQFKLGTHAEKTIYGIPPSNRGYQLLLNQGWDAEKGLGPESSGKKFPVKTVLKRDREGLGSHDKSDARVTHFGPADTRAVKRVLRPGERVERENTRSKRERKKQKTKEQQKEINIRRMLNEPDY